MVRLTRHLKVSGALLLSINTAAAAVWDDPSRTDEASSDHSIEIVWPRDVTALRKKDDGLDQYLRIVERRFAHVTRDVKVARGSKKLELELVLNRFGEVSQSTIHKSSGDIEQDRSVQRTLVGVIGERPRVEGLRCSTCAWYVRVLVEPVKATSMGPDGVAGRAAPERQK